MAGNWSRRDALKLLGLASVSFPLSSWATNENGERIILPDTKKHKRLARAVTAITLGAGSRGNVYGNYAVQYPDQLDIVGVAEPIPLRNERYAKKHAIPDTNRFRNSHTILAQELSAACIDTEGFIIQVIAQHIGGHGLRDRLG